MTRPAKIIRVTKVLGKVNPLPENKKYTFQNANEDVGKTNEIVDFLPIHLKSDADGIITGYTEIIEGIPVNILSNKHIGSITQLGSGISYAEYDGSINEATEFSKDLDEVTIMEANTHISMVFAANTKFLLFPR